MDESKIESAGLDPVAPDLATIDELVNPDDLPVLVAHLHGYGVPVLFRFGARTDRTDATQQIADVDQAGFALPDRDYYLKTDDRSVELRAKYLAHISRIFALAGAAPEKAAADAKAALAIETALATAALDRVKRRDPAATEHPMGLNELQRMTPNFSWRKYAIAADAPKFQAINVSVPDYMKALDRLIAATPFADLKAYLRWQLLHESADLLPKAFADADFDFFSRTLAGQQEQQPRWRRCVTADGCTARRSARQGVRRRRVRPAGESRHAADGAGHQGRDAPGHRRRAVDERRDEKSRDGEARRGGRSHRLPRHLARLLEHPRDARRCAREPAAGDRVRPPARRCRRSASRSTAASGA